MIEKALSYLNGVRNGTLPSCKWIKLAVERHDNDLKRSDWDFYFDEKEAARVLSIFPAFRFSKGEKSGEPFDIMPWFAALVYLAYGWRRKGGGRRFRKVYCKVPRGNAKTANLVNIATIGFLFDGVGDSEVYWLAMNKDQAKIGWDRQREMLRRLCEDDENLAGFIDIPEGKTSARITMRQGLSWVGYIGQDSKGKDGLSPHYVICDEYHEWPNDDLMNKMESGMVKVPDPVTWIITTAGYKPNGPNSQFLRGCKNMLTGTGPNEELLAFIYEMDDGDDWRSPDVWAKVNPGVGYCLSIDNLMTEYNKIATQGQVKEVDFRVKNLNEEYASQDGWVSDEVWMKCAGEIDFEALKNRECWGGLDLASTNDFNAFVLFFPPEYEGQQSVVLPWFWTTEDAISKSVKTRPFLAQWANEGFVKTTPGNVTDYDDIYEHIVGAAKSYRLQGIAFDRALSSYLTPKLTEAGIRMDPYEQSWKGLSPPAQYFERAVFSNSLLHDANPVARWMMGNIAMQYDRNGNHLPSKGASGDKIDFIAATLNAIGQWLTDRGEARFKSYLLQSDSELVVL